MIYDQLRIDPYILWPEHLAQIRRETSVAGFLYNEVGLTIVCYSCGHELYHWEPNDKPWVKSLPVIIQTVILGDRGRRENSLRKLGKVVLSYFQHRRVRVSRSKLLYCVDLRIFELFTVFYVATLFYV